MPKLGMLVNPGLDIRRAVFIFDEFSSPQVHGVVQWVPPGNDAHRATSALVPVLTIILLQHAGRAKSMHGALERRIYLLLGHAPFDECEPPDLRLCWTFGHPHAD